MDEEKIENEKLVYELGYHLLSTIEDVQVPAEAGKIKAVVEESGGKVFAEEIPKITALAYPLSKVLDSKKQIFNKAYFGWIKFEMEPIGISLIKSKIENLPGILRFIIIKTVREDTMHVPKIPMFKKENPTSREEKREEHTEKTKASEEEIDKSIEELVIES